jgi:hypothetical protein
MRDRRLAKLSPTELLSRDAARKSEVRALLKYKHATLSAAEEYYAAWIFHHGSTQVDAAMAKRLALQSFKRGYTKAGWLYAASTDRLLMRRKKPQKFGTQFFKKDSRSPWKLYKTEPGTSEAERNKYGVQSLEKQLKDIEKLNRIK